MPNAGLLSSPEKIGEGNKVELNGTLERWHQLTSFNRYEASMAAIALHQDTTHEYVDQKSQAVGDNILNSPIYCGIPPKVKTWFTCTEMEALVQTAVQFADANCAIFEPELGEHKLVYTQLHNDFKQLFEDRLNSFLASIGATPEAFYVAFQKAGHEGEVQTMAELMYTCLEYEFFCQIMCERKRELEAQHASGLLPETPAPGICGYAGHKDGYSGPGAPSAP
eukprot:s4367_g5.t3